MKPIASINIECIPEKEYLSPKFNLDIQSESDGVFIYETSNPSVFTVNENGIVTITGPGRAYVFIKQLESLNFGENSIERLIVVNKSKPPINITGPSRIELGNDDISKRILKIDTVENLINRVLSSQPRILQVKRILESEYELIPYSTGKASIFVGTSSNYYFNPNFASFDTQVIESQVQKSLILNLNTFESNFKHDALKDIYILTSNINTEINSNNLEINVQQETVGYNYNLPILNLNARNFIDNINNTDQTLLCCRPDPEDPNAFIEVSVQWDFGNQIVFDFFPHESNINDRPRINLFRSDGNYLDYISGGKTFLRIPQDGTPNSPGTFLYEKWGDRNTGKKILKLPNLNVYNEDPASNLYYGLDVFTKNDYLPLSISPSFPIAWITDVSVINETKFTYILTGGENFIIQWSSSSSSSTLSGPSISLNTRLSSFNQVILDISWTTVVGAISYQFDISTSSTFSNFVNNFENFPVNGFGYSVNGLPANPIYYVRVRGIGPNGVLGAYNPILTSIAWGFPI
jgi:hypothetical protein